jgi:hypothetical protein
MLRLSKHGAGFFNGLVSRLATQRQAIEGRGLLNDLRPDCLLLLLLVEFALN